MNTSTPNELNLPEIIDAHYDLGEIISENQLFGGIQNLTKKITTEKGEYVGKVYVKASGTLERLESILRIIRALKDIGTPVPDVLKTNTGELLIPIDHSIYYAVAVIEYLDGFAIFRGGMNQIDLEYCGMAGDTLARLHNDLEQIEKKGLKLVAPSDWGTRISRLDGELAHHLEQNYLNLPDEMIRNLDTTWQNVRESITAVDLSDLGVSELMHGDFNAGNLLFSESGVCGILDFDTMRWGSYIEDLGISVFHWFWHEHKMLTYDDVKTAFLTSYLSTSTSINNQDIMKQIDAIVLATAWQKLNSFLIESHDELQIFWHNAFFAELEPKLFLLSAELS